MALLIEEGLLKEGDEDEGSEVLVFTTPDDLYDRADVLVEQLKDRPELEVTGFRVARGVRGGQPSRGRARLVPRDHTGVPGRRHGRPHRLR